VALADGAGVTVNLNGSQLMHRTPVMYPAEALAKGVEGTVVVQVRLDANGEVIDAAVLSGPDELRRGVQQSVLNWHFDKSAGSATRVVNIDFVKPPSAAAATATPAIPARPQILPAPAPAGTTSSSQPTQNPQLKTDAAMSQLQELARQQRTQQSSTPPQIGNVAIIGLSDSAREQLSAQLPVHTGDSWSPELALRTREIVSAFDSHLSSSVLILPNGSAELRIMTQQPSAFGGPGGRGGGSGEASAPRAMIGSVPPGALTVPGNVQAANLISSTKPIYPPLAKMARQQGTVSFQATIAKDGTMADLAVLSGPPLLIQAAMQAVKTWVYQPTMLNGAPVEVVTTIDVNFTLSQ
jgi:TonB family protein